MNPQPKSYGPAEETSRLSTPSTPLANSLQGYGGGALVFFYVVVVIGIVKYAVGFVRFLTVGNHGFAAEAGVIAAILSFGLFWTHTRNRRTPTYWKCVLALFVLSSAGNFMANRASGEDKAWLFWGLIWLAYWSKSRTIALRFAPKSSWYDDSPRSAGTPQRKADRLPASE